VTDTVSKIYWVIDRLGFLSIRLVFL